MPRINLFPQLYIFFATALGIFVSFYAYCQNDNQDLNKLKSITQAANEKTSQEKLFSGDLKKLLKRKRVKSSDDSAPDLMEMINKPDNNHANESNLTDKAAHQEQLENALAERTFQELLDKMMPLNPQQIRRLRARQSAIDLASRGPIGVPPKPVAISHFVSLAPGDKLPLIRMQQGFVSSLVFVDTTGSPWPIEMYSLGDPSLFNVSWDKKSNILLIQANSEFEYGNLAVKLVGQNTPVMLTLIPGQQEVDYRVDLRIQGMGPNALPVNLSDGLPPKTNDLLLSMLDGVPPAKAKELHVSGGNGQAWILDNKLYLRTRMTLISPGWLSSISSPDGMNVYEIMKTPLLLVSEHGQMLQLKVEGM